MKGVVYKDKFTVEVRDIAEPKIKDPRDAILRITSAAICGSDLHMYDGRTNIGSGCVFGHENMGVLEEIGEGVMSLKKGDRVVVPFNISCGYCFNCLRGFTSACLTTNAKNPGAAYGYANMGPYPGGQAEYLRVPFADFNCIKLPGEPGDEFEEDFLMLADIFPTGYHATELAMVVPGGTVAIYGAGPVGLLAAHSAILKGAAQVFVVDQSEPRLKIAEEFGAIPINFREGDPVKQIMGYRVKNPLIRGYLLPGEEKLAGVMSGIDAVGYQARSLKDPEKEDPMAVLKQLAEVVNATGAIGIVGVYPRMDPGGVDELAKTGNYCLPLGWMFEKGIQVGMGQTPVKKYANLLRDLIVSGRAKPSRIISHRVPLDQAPEAYRLFDHRGIGEGRDVTKVVLKPGLSKEM